MPVLLLRVWEDLIADTGVDTADTTAGVTRRSPASEECQVSYISETLCCQRTLHAALFSTYIRNRRSRNVFFSSFLSAGGLEKNKGWSHYTFTKCHSRPPHNGRATQVIVVVPIPECTNIPEGDLQTHPGAEDQSHITPKNATAPATRWGLVAVAGASIGFT